MRLSVHLFDETIEDFSDVFTHPPDAESSRYEEIPLTTPHPDMRAYVQLNNRSRPAWLQFVASNCELPNPNRVWNVSNSFVLVVRVSDTAEDRYFAITTGYGFTALNRRKLEDDFGLTVTLNSVDASQLRAAEVRTLGIVTHQKHVAISKPSEVWELDVDPDQEMLGMLKGKPAAAEFAATIQGADSLSLTRDLAFDEIPAFCADLLRRFQSTTYREHFAFVDRRRPVKKESLKNELNALLAAAIAERDPRRVALVRPLTDQSEVSVIEVSSGRGRRPIVSLDIHELYRALDILEHRGPDILSEVNIVGTGDDGRMRFRDPLEKLLVFETAHRGRFYVCSLGRWYRVDPDYVRAVDQRVSELDVQDIDGLLPEMQIEPEPAYNARAAGNESLQLFDRVTFRDGLGGQSRIEVCDLLSEHGHFICVKKYNGSADLSHLFSQGSVSAALFRDERRYRAFTAEQITRPWTAPFDVEEPDMSRLTLVYAIAAPPEMAIPQGLPFFSKVNLLHHAKLVRRTGFRLRIAKIPITSPESERPRRRRRRATR